MNNYHGLCDSEASMFIMDCAVRDNDDYPNYQGRSLRMSFQSPHSIELDNRLPWLRPYFLLNSMYAAYKASLWLYCSELKNRTELSHISHCGCQVILQQWLVEYIEWGPPSVPGLY